RRIEDRGTEELPGFEVVGNEDAAFDAEPRGVGGNAVRQVTGRRAGQDVEPELERTCGSNRYHAILVGERRMVHGIVLDIQLAEPEPLREPVALHQGREP